jgi:hypothetical protein
MLVWDSDIWPHITIEGPPLWSSDQSYWLQNAYVLCLLWGTNWIYICYVKESRPPLWSSGQSSWLQNADVLCLLWGTNWIYICYVEERDGQLTPRQTGRLIVGRNVTLTLTRSPLWSSGRSSWLQNGDVFCFLWGTNRIYICYLEESRPPPWLNGQYSWQQIQRYGFYSLRYHNFWEVVDLERGSHSLVSTIEELLQRKSTGSSPGNRDYSRKGSDPR